MVGVLEFEKPVIELRNKISELKEFTKNADVDLSAEIEKLEARLEKLEKEIFWLEVLKNINQKIEFYST